MSGGLPGFLTKVNLSGTATAMTSQAMSTHSTVANTYRINSTARRVWNRTASFTFYKNSGSSTVAAIPAGQIESVDYLFGKVVFNTTQPGNIGVSGQYLPLTSVPGGHAYNLNVTRESIDNTDYTSSGWRSRIQSFTDVSLTISRWDNVDLNFYNKLVSGDPVVVEVRPGGDADMVYRGFFVVESEDRAGDVAGLESGDVTLQIDSTTAANFSFGSIV